jgi:GNAT superfamily N-acetyltransferase
MTASTGPGRDPSGWFVDAVRPEDHDTWARLHRGYLDFYEVADPERVSAVVWGWLQDPAHDLECLVVRPAPGSAPVGIAHHRPFPRPLAATTACFLDDLFVDPSARGTGAVDALLTALQEQCRRRGWSGSAGSRGPATSVRDPPTTGWRCRPTSSPTSCPPER